MSITQLMQKLLWIFKTENQRIYIDLNKKDNDALKRGLPKNDNHNN